MKTAAKCAVHYSLGILPGHGICIPGDAANRLCLSPWVAKAPPDWVGQCWMMKTFTEVHFEGFA
jgi:hypothetical protein